MDLLQTAVLALVQGITEFLPISSSGHLVVTSQIFGWPDQGLSFDVAVHVGTLLAVMIYFWRDLLRMIVGLVSPLWGRFDANSRLTWGVIVGTLPIVAAGYLISTTGDDADGGFMNGELMMSLRDPVVIGVTSIGFGILLFIADAMTMTIKRLGHLRLVDAFIIGLAQVLALVPGTSRAGVTMTAARFLGYERDEAARFSLLLSIPAIAGAGLLIGKELVDAGDWAVTTDALLGLALSFVAALVAIWAMMAWLRKAGYWPFVLYRIAFGAFLIWWFWGTA